MGVARAVRALHDATHGDATHGDATHGDATHGFVPPEPGAWRHQDVCVPARIECDALPR